MERFRRFKEKFKSAEKKPSPMSWDEWKKLILEHKTSGIPPQNIPDSFIMADGFMNHFDQMLPARNGIIDDSKYKEAAEKARNFWEVGRGIRTDAENSRFLIQEKNCGESGKNEHGVYLHRKPIPGEIAALHTHPVDSMPSSADLLYLIYPPNVLEGVITPHRVILMIKTIKTPVFYLPAVAKGYLHQMKKEQSVENMVSPMHQKEKQCWETTYADLAKLHIVGYEAPRGENVFVRKTKDYTK